jgi:hypothetical protein
VRALLLASLVALGACREEPTQTWVFVHADPAFAAEADALRVVVEGAGETVEERTDPIPPDREILASLFLVPKNGDANRTWAIHATLLDGEAELAHLRVGGGYAPGETLVTHAHFESGDDCLALGDCGPGRTCQAGRCVGSCFETSGPDAPTTRHLARCGECATCVEATCQARADGSACGCDGDGCRDGACQPVVEVRDVWVAQGHGCARTSDGLWCWGSARTEQTSFDTDTDRPMPVDAPEVASVFDMALANEFSCATWIRSGPEYGRTCWGWGDHGAFAMGELSGAQPFLEVSEGSDDTIADIDAGARFQCARRESGLVQCAGPNDSNQLAQPDSVEGSTEWVDIPGRYRDLSVSDSGVCAVAEDGTWCWGLSTFDGSIRSPELECIPGEGDACFTDLVSVTAGSGRGCGLSADGQAHCWGGNPGGLLGVAGPERVTMATALDTDLRFSRLEAARTSFCGIDASDGGLHCWGGNGNGQLGVGDRLDVPRPRRVAVDAGDRWRAVAMSEAFSCGIREGGELYCWGSNAGGGPSGSRLAGRLGLGLGTDPSDPASQVFVTRPRRVCFERP